MVTAKLAGVQQVTSRPKRKTAEWEAQEAVRKMAQQWVEKENHQNAEQVLQDLSKQITGDKTASEEESRTEYLAGLELTNCQITIPLAKFLQLVTRFADAIMTMQKKETILATSIQFTNPSEGPTVMEWTSEGQLLFGVKGNSIPQCNQHDIIWAFISTHRSDEVL